MSVFDYEIDSFLFSVGNVTSTGNNGCVKNKTSRSIWVRSFGRWCPKPIVSYGECPTSAGIRHTPVVSMCNKTSDILNLVILELPEGVKKNLPYRALLPVILTLY